MAGIGSPDPLGGPFRRTEAFAGMPAIPLAASREGLRVTYAGSRSGNGGGTGR